MPNYRRVKVAGAYYFFTLVTYGRASVFSTESTFQLLEKATNQVKEEYPFHLEAHVVLPDHLHLIMELPEGDAEYSKRLAKIKRCFGDQYIQQYPSHPVTESGLIRRERSIWQRRFWEHYIKDQTDLDRHINYIHYNPVKHGCAKNVAEWEWSSYHAFFERGYYDRGWGNIDYDIGIEKEWD